MPKQPVDTSFQQERGHSFHKGDTDWTHRSCELRKFSVKFGYQDEIIRTDSGPETHLGSQRALDKENLC